MMDARRLAELVDLTADRLAVNYTYGSAEYTVGDELRKLAQAIRDAANEDYDVDYDW